MDATFWLVLALFITTFWSSFRADTTQRLRRLERRVDLILKHLGVNPDQGVHAEIMELLKAGKKIQAIKVYREQTGCGLKEAKDYVESL
jgi:hypothetical protein